MTAAGDSGMPTGSRSRFLAAAMRLNAMRSTVRPRTRRILTLVGFTLFAVGVAVAWTNLPEEARSIDALSLLPVPLLGVPLTILANAWEYQLIVELAGKRTRLKDAYRLSLFASAANVLPIPGSTLVRADALHRLGVDLRMVATSTVATALGFLGVTALLGGSLAAANVNHPVLWGVIALGAVMTAIALLTARRMGAPLGSIAWRLIAIEAFSVVVKGGRFWVILSALGYDPRPEQLVALTSMSVIATATGFFPGGLGLSEALTAIIAPAVGLPAAVGLMTSAIDNFLHYATLFVVLVPLSRRRPVEDDQQPEPAAPSDPDTR